MGFIRNFEIWNNQRPLICNFDILDYCSAGIIGNTCTENTTAIDNIDWEDSYSIARSTGNAWFQAVNEYTIATFANFYENASCNTEATSCIPDQQITKCTDADNFAKLTSLYYGPDGFIEKYKLWFIARQKWWNCVVNPIYKLTGVHTYSETIPSYIDTVYTWDYSIDYTNYQTVDKIKYLEYRNAMGDMMQSLKQLMIAGLDHPFTKFDIPTV